MDEFECRYESGELLCVTFALDCYGRDAMSWAAAAVGHTCDIMRDVMLAPVENRFGNALHTPSEIEWLSEIGRCYSATQPPDHDRPVGGRAA